MTTKLAIAINLNDLEELMKEYTDEEMAGDEFVLDQMRLGLSPLVTTATTINISER
jgi:hypothetical protein